MGDLETGKRKGVDALLGRTSYLDHWAKEATLHADRRGSALELVSLARATLESTFGADWLEAHARREQRNAIAGDSKKHPLGLLLEAPSASSVAKALELALYLHRCATLPKFDEVVTHLRSAAQYSRGKLQLALAYRIQRCGVSGLELEPDADEGRKADVGFSQGERRFLVECYEPTPERHHELEALVGPSAQKCFDAASRAAKRVVVRAHVRRPDLLDPATRKRLEGVARQLIQNVSPRSRETASEDCFEVEVFDTSGATAEDVQALAWSLTANVRPAWVVNAALVRKSDLGELARGDESVGRPVGDPRGRSLTRCGEHRPRPHQLSRATRGSPRRPAPRAASWSAPRGCRPLASSLAGAARRPGHPWARATRWSSEGTE